MALERSSFQETTGKVWMIVMRYGIDDGQRIMLEEHFW